MTSDESRPADSPVELSEDERTAIFAAANAPRDRRGALSAGSVPVSTKFIAWMVALILFLGVGGEIGQHYFETYGKTPTVTAPLSPVLNVTTTTNANTPTLISLETFMDLKLIGSAVAPPIDLTSQTGREWRLSSQHGRAVVVTFYNSICNDICTVLGKELRQAQSELGALGAKVEFVIVNTDPRDTSIAAARRALVTSGLTKYRSVFFLSGSLAKLDTVWKAYGIKVEVGRKFDQVSHTNALYYVGPNGNLVAYATPFAIESKTGTFSWNAPSMRLYAQGIAETADSLIE